MAERNKDYTKTLRKARTDKGYSQEYVAKALGLTQTGYRRIENGEVHLKLETALQLGKLLEMDISQLLIPNEEKLNIQHNQDIKGGTQGVIVYQQQEGEVAALRETLKAKDELITELRRRLGEL